ncbi:heme ABC transporter ATP-binding protein [Hahella aquimaris]|uniref:heme ABC transporter ATP-binding protein n=1 Tax=Hahella sp. HNIBRBA332 TaxID=3015983 RepID=UPI00273BD53F|nr:heme ABC transporter ATP-binding protein [Hahella sp. HNIBRBA332]WLQ14458.1 heme ABC transporter ATP-binding protein [Hahella sp. HNIBRBA332]
MIHAFAVSVIRHDKTLLEQINFSLSPGELVVTLGPNGAGKSTLLKTLAGELSPSLGHVLLDDEPISQFSLPQLSRRRAVLSQSVHLDFPFSAMEVVLMGAQRSVSGGDPFRLSQEALEEVDAGHLAQRNYQELSGGERQRVQIARALTQLWTGVGAGPQYLMLDEPTSALDLKHQCALLKLARRLAAKGVGVFCVLHDLHLASQYADRILLMNQGRIVAEGAPETLITTTNVREVYQVDSRILPHPVTQRPMVMID